MRLLSDLLFRLSSYLAYLLKWNRWANDQGKPDTNKPLDLKIEQLNKIIKKILRRLGSNIGEETIRKLCQVAPYLYNIRVALRADLGLTSLSIPATAPSRLSDVKKLTEYLLKNKVFVIVPNRALKGFTHIPEIWFLSVDWAKFSAHITKTKNKMSRSRTFQPETPNPPTPGAEQPQGVPPVQHEEEAEIREENEEEEEEEDDFDLNHELEMEDLLGEDPDDLLDDYS